MYLVSYKIDMEANTPASQRRGSGISISLAPSNNAVGGVITPAQAQNGMPMTGAQPMYQQGPYGPMYMQSPSYPVLMNPPHMPTVSEYYKPIKVIHGTATFIHTQDKCSSTFLFNVNSFTL